jgi:hypothetical protein
MVYIPFASLLGLQAAFDSFFEPKQPVQDIASITAADFINPTLGGGSLLDHDSGSGLGEPLNVSLSPPLPPPLRDELSNHATKSIKWKIQKQVIISGLSSEWVLSDGGFVHYANALGL